MLLLDDAGIGILPSHDMWFRNRTWKLPQQRAPAELSTGEDFDCWVFFLTKSCFLFDKIVCFPWTDCEQVCFGTEAGASRTQPGCSLHLASPVSFQISLSCWAAPVTCCVDYQQKKLNVKQSCLDRKPPSKKICHTQIMEMEGPRGETPRIHSAQRRVDLRGGLW